jgi:hypothetical protein
MFGGKDTSKCHLEKLRPAVVEVQTLRILATSQLCQMAGDRGKNQVSCQPAAMLSAY